MVEFNTVLLVFLAFLIGAAIISLGILLFIILQWFFYFKRRVKNKDYKLKDIILNHLEIVNEDSDNPEILKK